MIVAEVLVGGLPSRSGALMGVVILKSMRQLKSELSPTTNPPLPDKPDNVHHLFDPRLPPPGNLDPHCLLRAPHETSTSLVRMDAIAGSEPRF
jgi:hypothetical protein